MLSAIRKYDAYKDSGVEWLGEIPEHWSRAPLFKITKLKSISGCPDEELLSVYLNLGVIRFSDIDEKRTNTTSNDLSKYQLVTPGDFVLNNQQAWRGSVGVSKYRGIVSPAYLILSLDSSVDSGFSNYLFRDRLMVDQYLVASRGVGTIQRNLYWPHLKRATALIPPIQEQQAIANYLDDKTAKIDHAISIKEKQITLLKERKQIMIQDAVTRGLNPDVAMKDSGVEWLVEIPEHWITKRLKYLLIEFNERSKTGLEELLSLSKYRGIIPKSILGDRAGQAESLIGYKKVYKGHLVINKMQAVNGLLAVSGIDGITSPDYSVYQTKNNNILNINYLCFLLLQPEYLAEFKRRVTGVMEGFIRLYTDDLYDIPTMLPPIQEQQAIVAHIEIESTKIDQAINIQQQQIEKLKEYRSTLINSAVTGKIKVA